ncbi:inositol-3-phosphate synthase [Oceanobacillus sp. CFH 90083]|uniref:inositol-3-phosphate synthase n=1 Tax=Oceanobacillus sp. CFH 90083 TaxID=2592336 RepID=UPI00128CE265|nr:myo-inositol-1-phosphate synthase [Oceanobacillus sp. CFH 90083]
MKEKLKVVIAGVGSCSSSLLQFITLAKKRENELTPGLMCKQVGSVSIEDIEFVGAFDVDNNKIGNDLSEAIFMQPNVATKHIDVPFQNVIVRPGPLKDGLQGNLAKIIKPNPGCYNISVQDVAKQLMEMEAEILVCYLPTGSYEAVRLYAEACTEAKVVFINATPEPVAQDTYFQEKFENAGVPLLGDDLRSHFGATMLHTAMIDLLKSRNILIKNTYQLNFGGNTDFLNLSLPERSSNKQISKRRALNAAGIDASRVSAGPNGYVEYLKDNKICYLRIEADSVLGSEIGLEIKLEVEDSPNSAAVVLNALLVGGAAKKSKLSGPIDEVCAFLFKSPRKGLTEKEALNNFLNFIK